MSDADFLRLGHVKSICLNQVVGCCMMLTSSDLTEH